MPPRFLGHLDPDHLVAVGVQNMDGTGQTWIKGMDRAQNLQWLVGIGQRSPDQRRFIWSALPLGVTR